MILERSLNKPPTTPLQASFTASPPSPSTTPPPPKNFDHTPSTFRKLLSEGTFSYDVWGIYWAYENVPPANVYFSPDFNSKTGTLFKISSPKPLVFKINHLNAVHTQEEAISDQEIYTLRMSKFVQIAAEAKHYK